MLPSPTHTHDPDLPPPPSSMLGGMLESGLRNFFRSNLPLWWPAKWHANPTLNLGATGAGGWTLSLWSSATFGKVCEFFSVISPQATQHMVLQSKAGIWDAGWMLSLWSSASLEMFTILCPSTAPWPLSIWCCRARLDSVMQINFALGRQLLVEEAPKKLFLYLAPAAGMRCSNTFADC